MWRPLTSPVESNPLAVCSFKSIDPLHDLVAVDVVFPHFCEEAFEVKPPLSEPHQWYYQSLATSDSIVLLKIFDSKENKSTAFCECFSLSK